jgi:hypothetical protein
VAGAWFALAAGAASTALMVAASATSAMTANWIPRLSRVRFVPWRFLLFSCVCKTGLTKVNKIYSHVVETAQLQKRDRSL